MRTANIK